MGVPKLAGWFILDNPIKIDDNWGQPYFKKPWYLGHDFDDFEPHHDVWNESWKTVTHTKVPWKLRSIDVPWLYLFLITVSIHLWSWLGGLKAYHPYHNVCLSELVRKTRPTSRDPGHDFSIQNWSCKNYIYLGRLHFQTQSPGRLFRPWMIRWFGWWISSSGHGCHHAAKRTTSFDKLAWV